jgi:Icc protein
MKRAAWLTDLHLEFVCSSYEVHALCENIKAVEPDCILIGGDTGTAHSFEKYLLTLEKELQLPIYFVLGNHDFYHGSIKKVRESAAILSRTTKRIRWLPGEGVVKLTADTALIGHDGWADGRLGNVIDSGVQLSDYLLIEELTGLQARKRFKKLNELGDEAAEYFQGILLTAVTDYPNVLLLTHVPPFKSACWHEGRISDDEFLPHFACKSVGDVLVEIMREHPGSTLTVLCGHTHGRGEAWILPNVNVKTGGAEYGEPQLQEVIEI